ncbi:MAG: cytochrome c [Thiotrichales bacterium]|jgi:cytochrome c553|nr:cytochrome c [Thiotrichales bacterium]
MKKLIVAAALSMLAMGAAHAADEAAGKAKYASCAGCHGQNGKSMSPAFPTLQGKDAAYIEAQLHAFKDGKRNNPMMSPQAKGLSDADMANIAAFLAAQK